jgi:tetratricopeptide (TPR) repeat protein
VKVCYRRLFVCFAFGLLTVRLTAQPGLAQELYGEVRSQFLTVFHGLTVRLDSLDQLGESAEADVQSDGSFRFRNIPNGAYRLRLTNYFGDTIQEQLVTISPQTASLILRLAEPPASRPPSSSISVRRLLHPPAPKAWKAFRDAQKLSQSGKYEEAAAKLKAALAISPEFSEAWTNLTAQNIRLRRYEEAMTDATRAMEIAGANAVDLCNLSVSQWGAGRFPEALANALRCAELDPTSGQAQYLAGMFLATANRWREALPHLQDAARTVPAAREVLKRAPPDMLPERLP